MPNPTILLADDDGIFLENAKEFLSAHDYNVVCTSDPAEAARMLQETPIALAFLDIQFDSTDDRDVIGLKVAHETIDVSSVPKIILTQFDKAQYAITSLRPRHDGKTAAVDVIYKREGLGRLLEVIESNLNRARIFLSYVHEDQQAAEAIFQALSSVGFVPWIDRKGIFGGTAWKEEISKEIKRSDFFVVCISKRSFGQKGFFQREIKEAFDVLDEMPPGQIFLVPVRLEDCAIVHPRISQLHWVDMFDFPSSAGNQDGFHKLVRAIKQGMRQRINGTT